MSHPIVPREEAAEHLAVSPAVLRKYEALGFVKFVTVEGIEGYEPSEIPRLWRIVSYQRDLGVNLAGVDAILHMRDRIEAMHRDFGRFALDLHAILDERDRLEVEREGEGTSDEA